MQQDPNGKTTRQEISARKEKRLALEHRPLIEDSSIGLRMAARGAYASRVWARE